MVKVAVLTSIFASMTMVGNLAVNKEAIKIKEQNAQIIIEVDRDKDSLTFEGIDNTQKAVLNNIRAYATTNVTPLYNYKNLINAFAISCNEDDIDLIKQVPGVKHVTKNELHWVTQNVEAFSDAPETNGEEGEYGRNDNISAITMHKPEDTYEGEGTTIAVLDNEFYIKGAVKNKDGSITPAWNHEAFNALDTNEVAVKHKNKLPGINFSIAGKSKAYDPDAPLGQEGSLYFNSKIPFYFDYGGSVETYSATPVMDCDVVSPTAYHGSHVASIASANAPEYKGIAPNSQLVLMKVFTDFKATAIDKKMGLNSYSGAYDMQILNALEDCITLGVDGINMSLGSNLDDFDGDSSTKKVIRNLIDSGIMTSISAGNSGKTSFNGSGAYSNWTSDMTETGILSSYANESEAMTIASGQPTEIFYETGFDLGGATVAYADQIVDDDNWGTYWDQEHKMEDLFFDGSTYEKEVPWVYIPGFGVSSDYDKASRDVSGCIAVINRGNTSFEEKYTVATSKGAIGVIIINNDPTAGEFNFRCSFSESFKPDYPLCLVLYKDKAKFENEADGTITLIRKKLVDNKNKYTMSNFSSDGATFNLDLKPDITAPGELIRGAVPPQKKEDKKPIERKDVYEYLSGTSMSAPNYAGCQSLLLSEVSGPIYEYLNAHPTAKMTQEQKDAINNRRKTVDMIMMSTADPMHDALLDTDSEGTIKPITSPRKQGAGMVNLEDAYNTDVYLEGMDENGNGISKSKVLLKNNKDINEGTINISFIGHNTDTVSHTYDVELLVMRPDTVDTQDIITKDYLDKGEVTNIEYFPGSTYFVKVADGHGGYYAEERHSTVIPNYKDVYTLTRDLEYYATADDCLNEHYSYQPRGKYYNASTTGGVDMQDLPTYKYQSVFDKEIAKVNLSAVTIAPGDSVITLDTYKLSAEAKAEIAEFYEYGTYIEGYVTLKSRDSQPDLSIPYLGYYSTMHDQGKDYTDAPIVEPFTFEKNKTTVYPSDLVNSLTKTLLGKEFHDMGSMWVTGYVKPGLSVDTESVLKNDNNFTRMTGFHQIGTDPSTNGDYFDNVTDNLYVGDTHYTNTMIIQQFVLRSVKNNFFTITNKDTGQVIYRDAMEDMIFGGSMDEYPLYKSHVDETYLGSGYVSHRALAVVPLYDVNTGTPFPSGKYEITFNYLLAGTLTWEKKSYNLTIDTDAPEISSITTNGDKVQINIKERNLSKVVVGEQARTFTQIGPDTYQVEMGRSAFVDIINRNINVSRSDTGRLFVQLTDKAYGVNGAIVRFKVSGKRYDPISGDVVSDYDLTNYTMAQNYAIGITNDIVDENGVIKLVDVPAGTSSEIPFTADGFVLISRGPVNYGTPATGGCGGNITTTSITLSAVALVSFIALVISKRKKKLGGNHNE